MDIDETPLTDFRDGAVMVIGSILATAAWILPESRWPSFADRLARFRIRNRSPLSASECARIRIVVGNRPDAWIRDSFWPESLAQKYLSWMYIFACHRPGGRRFESRLTGGEHIDEALEGGRGVVLFTATFIHKDLMAKAALAQAGYEITHLSRDTHGFSETRLGKRWLNPIYTSIETRHLKERLVFSGSNTKAVSTKVRERLKQNRPVMITVTPLGRHVSTLPFLHGRIHIATGGLNFACENDTPVLPVFTVRQTDGAMTTFIGPALRQPEGAERAEKIDALLQDFVPRLEKCVSCYPEQFSFPISDQFGKALLDPVPAAIEAPPEETENVTAA